MLVNDGTVTDFFSQRIKFIYCQPRLSELSMSGCFYHDVKLFFVGPESFPDRYKFPASRGQMKTL